jgi:hypothetical protein
MKLGSNTMTSGFSILIVLLVTATYLVYLFHGQPDDAASLGDSLSAVPSGETLPGPSPELSARQTLTVIMDALRQNDTPRADAGIDTAFRFASPGNRMNTGPIANFRQLVRAPAFAPMIDHQSAEVDVLMRRGDQAVLMVRLIAADGRECFYEVIMSRQYYPPYQGCWMTDGVRPVAPSEFAPPMLPPESPPPETAPQTPGSQI